MDRPWVLAFLHGTQWPLLAWKRRRRTLVMVSWSRDGAIQAGALTTLGLGVVRGSSSRGGIRGLARLVRQLRVRVGAGGADAAFAVDGPRGPYGKAKGGARVAARAAGGVLVPIGSAIERGVVLARAWDRFGLAWPFSRVVVCLGAPLEPVEARAEEDVELESAIAAVNVAAREWLDERRRPPQLAHDGGAPALNK
jgi:hypothetical protein